MKFRKLRIAFSAFCGIVCLLLIALWMRSYWYHDGIFYLRRANIVGVESLRGNLLPFFIPEGYSRRRWYVFSGPIMGPVLKNLSLTEYPTNFSLPVRSFTSYKSPYYFSVVIPHWFAALLITALGSVPWLRWRFSLRTQLIATMLDAIMLGLAVYAAGE